MSGAAVTSRQKAILTALLFGSAVGAMLESALTLSVLAILSGVLPEALQGLVPETFSRNVAIALGLLLVVIAAFRIALATGYMRFSESVRAHLLARIERAVLGLSPQELAQAEPPLNAALYGSVDTVATYVGELRSAVPAVLSSIVMIAALIFVAPFVFVTLLAVLAGFALALRSRFRFSGEVETRAASHRERWSETMGHALSAVPETRLNPLLDGLMRKRFDLEARHHRAELRGPRWGMSVSEAVSYVLISGFALGLVLSAWAGVWDRNLISAAVILIILLLSPLMTASALFSSTGASVSALTTLRSVLKAQPSVSADAPLPLAEPRALVLAGFRPAVEAPRDWMTTGVTACFQPSDVVFVTGENGAGKTTLLEALCGLFPSAGGCGLGDGGLFDPQERRAMVNGVFADSQSPMPRPEELTMPLRRAMMQVGLIEVLGDDPARWRDHSLSFGQQRRLDLAYMLAHPKPIALFDETGANQSPAFRRTFYTDILPGLARSGQIVFVVSHDDAFFGQGTWRIHLGASAEVTRLAGDHGLSNASTG